jgi:hypothetical protein
MFVKCHEFFGCKKKSECIMSNEEEKRNCWEIEPALSLCLNHATKGSLEIKDKLLFCKNCLYYEHINKTKG